MEDSHRKRVYLAALLHDIGKFCQRADGDRGRKMGSLSRRVKKMEAFICPEDPVSEERSHKHVLWTHDFLANSALLSSVRDEGESLFRDKTTSSDNLHKDSLVNLAANHHLPHPDSDMQKLVQMADWWSAGTDRLSSGEDHQRELSHQGYKFTDFRNVPLFSMFNRLHVDAHSGSGHGVAYGLKPLSADRNNIFPESLPQDNIRSLKEDYEKLWQGFEKEFAQLPAGSFSGFEESLFYLLKKYTWCIPSNTKDMVSESLFDHLKTTAAIADSLYMAWKDKAFASAFDFSARYDYLKQGHYPLMMLGIDLSGIQQFIYDIASRKAAQSLKGRSFYLQLLMDAILQKFRDNPIQAKAANTLYSSGGKAYLLLANTDEVKEKIFGKGGIKEVVEDELWEEHKGRISINMAGIGFAYHTNWENNSWKTWVSVDGEPGGDSHISHVWKSLADKLSQQKGQKFKARIVSHFDQYFDETHPGLQAGGSTAGQNGVKTCAVTGEEISGNAYPLDNTTFVTASVKNQTDLGKCLKDAHYILSLNQVPTEDKSFSHYAKAKAKILSSRYYLFDQKALIRNKADLKKAISSVGYSKIRAINDVDFLKDAFEDQPVSYGYLFYGGNKQACHRSENGSPEARPDEKNGEVPPPKGEKTFDELARTANNKNTLLGVLRMDLDNLGKLFIDGFKDGHVSLSAYATLSFQLEMFFCGYVNTLRDREVESDSNGSPIADKSGNPVYLFRDWLNILYSGGDDLFVIGRWDKTIAFAELVKKRFEAFTGRKDMGISGGIAFVSHKFPIAKAAHIAGEAESASKALKNKNAITFFGETISWDNEFMVVKDLKDKLVKHITRKDKPLSKAILHRLILFNTLKDKHLKTPGQRPDFSFLWHTAYYLKRYVEQYKPKQNQEHRETVEFVLNELQEKLFDSSKDRFRFFELAALAARWAEMELKTSLKNN